MKKILLSFTIILMSLLSYSQINDNFNIDQKCSHSTNNINKDLSFYLYNWQSEYMDDYDVTFYFLDIEVSNSTIFVDGSTTINGVALVDLDTFAIELVQEQVISKILFNGVEYTNYTRDGNNVIVPVNQISVGSSFSAQIFYSGQPQTGGFFSGISTGTGWGKDVTWTLSEPFAASDWFAVKQDLEDKADSVWVFLTTSSDNYTGSQGILTDVVDLGNGKSRFEWKSNYPIDYYLISFAVSEYQEYDTYAHPTEMAGDSILIQNLVYDSPGCLETYKDGIDATGSMIDLYSDLYILYPFWQEKYGHCLTPLGGGMEHQTMTTIGGFSFGLVAHELGHMWFGDNVTCATWSDIWINEGFATYSNYLAEEYLHGWSSGVSFIKNAQNSAMASPGGSTYIPEDEIYPGNEYRIFDGRLTYNKGAAIIHMLRHEIQDDSLFFNVMGSFQTAFTDSTATGEDFKNIAEDVTGMDFGYFFDQWYYGEGYPKYDIEYYNAGGTVHITTLQTPSASTPFFEMLLDIQLFFTDGTDTIVSFRQTDNVNNFSLYTGKTVGNLKMDPNEWNIELVTSVIVGTDETQSTTSFKIGQNTDNESVILYFIDKIPTNKNITVSTIGGRTVFTGETNEDRFTINTSSFAKGVYIVSALNGNDTFVRKFIK